MPKFILKCKCGNTDLEYLGDDLCMYYCKKCDTEYDINFDLYELVTELDFEDLQVYKNEYLEKQKEVRK